MLEIYNNKVNAQNFFALSITSYHVHNINTQAVAWFKYFLGVKRPPQVTFPESPIVRPYLRTLYFFCSAPFVRLRAFRYNEIVLKNNSESNTYMYIVSKAFWSSRRMLIANKDFPKREKNTYVGSFYGN